MTLAEFQNARSPIDRAQITRTRGLPTLYLATWAALACISTGYLGLAVLKVSTTPIKASDTSQPIIEKLTTEVASLRRGLTEYQTDIGTARADRQRHSQDAAVVATLTAIEERMSIITGQPVTAHATPAAPVAASPPAPQTPPLAAAAPLKPSLPLETGSLAAPPKSLVAPARPVNPPMTDPLVGPAPIAFGPAQVKPEPKPLAVQLSSAPTLDALRLNWSLLSDQHAEALGKLQPRFVAGGTDQAGPTYDLLAGPIKTAAEAKRICKALAARGSDCRIAQYIGEGL